MCLAYRLHFLWLMMLPSTMQDVCAQHYRAESTDPRQPFYCGLTVLPDSSFRLLYRTQGNRVYREYLGCIRRTRDSLYCMEGHLFWGHDEQALIPNSGEGRSIPSLPSGTTLWYRNAKEKNTRKSAWKQIQPHQAIPEQDQEICLRMLRKPKQEQVSIDVDRGKWLKPIQASTVEFEWVIKPLYAQTAGDGLPHGGGLILFQHVPGQKSNRTTRKKFRRKDQRKFIKGNSVLAKKRVKRVATPPRR